MNVTPSTILLELTWPEILILLENSELNNNNQDSGDNPGMTSVDSFEDMFKR